MTPDLTPAKKIWQAPAVHQRVKTARCWRNLNTRIYKRPMVPTLVPANSIIVDLYGLSIVNQR
jgi:hypothetical protein